jgi:hypothetical protein
LTEFLNWGDLAAVLGPVKESVWLVYDSAILSLSSLNAWVMLFRTDLSGSSLL